MIWKFESTAHILNKAPLTPKELLLGRSQTRRQFARLASGTCSCCYAPNLTASVKHDRFEWAPSTWLGSVPPLQDLRSTYQPSQATGESAAHNNKQTAPWDSNMLYKESWEHLNQTGRLEWKARFRTPMIKPHYSQSTNIHWAHSLCIKNTFMENGTSIA